MKKYFSVFMLNIRSVIYKVLTMFISVSVIFTVYFYLKCLYESGRIESGFAYTCTENIAAYIIFSLGFAALSLILMFSFNDSLYTLKRLSISEKEFFMVQGTCNVFMYIMYFALFTLLYFISVFIWKSFAGDIFNSQSVFFAFIRNNYAENIFPLFDPLRFIRNILIVISAGYCTAEASFMLRRGRKSILGFISFIFPLFFMNLPAGIWSDNLPLFIFDIIPCLGAVAFIIIAFLRVYGGSYEKI